MIFARLPFALARFPLRVGQPHIERAVLGIEFNDIAIAQKPDRPARRGFRPNMADAKAARGAGETSVSNERYFVAHALAIERGGGREHLAHARPTLGTLVADDQHLAFLVFLVLHRLEAGLFA